MSIISIDEQVIPFKGKHNLKRYLPKNPKKWGYKRWAHAGLLGYVYDFEVDGGLDSKRVPTNCDPPAQCGESDFVVLRLSNDLNQFQHELFFDSELAIFHCLSWWGIWSKKRKFGQ